MVSESNGGLPPAQELETFLPSEETKGGRSSGKYSINTAEKDLEGADFDPFRARKLENPTTDCDTLTHLLKASLGTGILAMPFAFKSAGLAMGIVFTVLVAFICTHCAYILIKCAHILYKRTKVTAMGFAEVSRVAFENGPNWGKKYANFSSYFILWCLFITYFGTCSVYTVIIAKNFQQVIEHHTQSIFDERIAIAALLVPLILLAWLPNLKALAPVSMVANVFMAVGLGITFYYLVTDMPAISERPLIVHPKTWPDFFSITIFAMEAIGVVMPLENAMKTPNHMIGLCGVLNQGMSGVTLVYILLGFLGFVRYGDTVDGSITLNLPVEEIPAQVVKILIGLAVFCTFGLQFFVCIDIGWNAIKDRYASSPKLANYILRTIMVLLAVMLAIAVPTISPFIGLIGAFCFSILGLLVPALIEIVTLWEDGFGPWNWIIWKNVLVGICGVIALVAGTNSAINDIYTLYTKGPE